MVVPIVAVAAGILGIFGTKAALDYGYAPVVVGGYEVGGYEPRAWLPNLALSLLIVSIVAMCLAYLRPILATALALLPFGVLTFRVDWLVWWVVAQAIVLIVAASRSPRTAVLSSLGMGLPCILLVVYGGVIIVGPGTVYLYDPWTWTWIHLGILITALLIGRAIGVLGRGHVTELILTQRERLLAQRESTLNAAQAAQAERTQLARDLHDVIAHHVSLIAVRAEAAPYTTAGDAGAMRSEFGAIAEDARRTLDDLRGVLGVLHRSQTQVDLAPQPTLQDLPDVVGRARAAGQRISTIGVEDSWIVPEAMGYMVYRLVQEALTNARKHARGADVTIDLIVDDTQLMVTVTNTPPVRSAGVRTGAPRGSGLAAMRERVEAMNGVFTAGPTPDAGFKVAARIPMFGPHR